MLKEERQTAAPRRRLVSRSADVTVTPQLMHPCPMDSNKFPNVDRTNHQDHQWSFQLIQPHRTWSVLAIIPLPVVDMRQSGLVSSHFCCHPYLTKDLRQNCLHKQILFFSVLQSIIFLRSTALVEVEHYFEEWRSPSVVWRGYWRFRPRL